MGGGKGGGGGGDNMGNMFMGLAAMQAADKQYQLGMEQLKWAKETQAKYEPYMLASADQGVKDQKFSSEQAHAQWDNYNQMYLPMEQKFIEDANNWDSPERRERMAGQAQAGVASQFEQARTAAQQQLESFGVDPTSTRFASLDLGTRVQQAAAAAGQGTKAIQDTEQMGVGLRSQAVNTGRGYQQNVNATTQTGTQAGNAGAGTLNGFFGTSSNAMTAPNAWFTSGNGAQSNAITAFNNYTNNGIRQQQANQQGAQGMMQGISGLMSGIMSLEDGGAIPDQALDMQRGPDGSYGIPTEPGGHVPYSASPSQGAVTDDIPARLNAGEFVIPKEVVEWEGQKNIYKMIDKAKSEREQVEATTETKPDYSFGIPEAPRFISGGNANAIPM